MKNRWLNFRSFAARLSLWVILTVAAILLVTAVVANLFVRDGILREEKLRANGALENAEEHIEDVFIAVETAVKNHTSEIKKNLEAPHEDMYHITREIVETNPMIVGSAIAFEPNYYPEEGRYFSPYSYRNMQSKNDTIISKQLGTATYDYPTMEWYQEPKKLKQGYWSEPYCDTGGGEITMTTYSYPLMDDEGNVFAVLTADVSLDWLSQMMDSLKYYSQSYSFIISRDGTFLTHPSKDLVLTENIFSFAKRVNDADLTAIAHNMTSGKKDMRRFHSPNLGSSFLFYKPIRRTGWSVAIVCSADEFFHNATQAGLIVAVIILLMLLLLAFILRKGVHHLTQPLVQFTNAVNEVANGNLQATLPKIKTKDEMMRLHNSFITMQKSLTQQMEELKQVNEQKGRIEGELKVASNIQRAMLPKIFPPYPDRDDIDIYGQQTPAKAVGGDLFDFYIRDEKLFFCIGDVSGKGVPASLVMAVARSLFRTLSMHEPHPERIISQMNDRMAEDNELNMFVTLFLGVLDLPTGRLRYCNAGHNAPLILIENDHVKQKEFLPCDSNLPIGIMGGWKFTLQETTIDVNTTIFLYTDGLTEAEDMNHQLFGEERMINAIPFSTGSQEIIKRMTEAVNVFTGEAEQSDDLTMLTIRYTKRQHLIRFQKEITLNNDIEQIPQLTTYVDAVCEAMEFDAATSMQMNLAIEEAVVNVMNYAYPKGVQGDIRIIAEANDLRLKFTISDSGMPFDPTMRQAVDTTLSAEERPIGGLGIHLITQLMDSINYERKDNMNVLTLRKKLSPIHPAVNE
ncbi:MAG: SpoIIE family protein phosphatase [Bacteroidaceae bacterium]|nr:SpoIIE family protein phosphatase [Bacteroidaceae bacterium]